jgi:hypothetical protein
MAGTGTLYDFPAPSLSGQNLTVDRYLNDPVRIYRALRTLVQQRLIGDRLLTGRVNLTGTGSGVYEIAEAILPDFMPLVVPPLDEYPLTTFTPGTPAQVVPVKWGQAFEMSDKVIAHARIDLLRRNLVKVANRLVKNSDTITLAAIASLVTQTQAAQNGAWGTTARRRSSTSSSASPRSTRSNLGYTIDTGVLTPTKWANLMASPNVLANAATRGQQHHPGDRQHVRVRRHHLVEDEQHAAGWSGMLLDSTQLGSQAYEDLGDPGEVGYTGTPGQVESASYPLPRAATASASRRASSRPRWSRSPAAPCA